MLKFYSIINIFFGVVYLLLIICKKFYKRHYKEKEISKNLDKKEKSKIEFISVIFLFAMVVINTFIFIEKKLYNPIFFPKYIELSYKIAIAIMFFIAGVLAGNIKKDIKYSTLESIRIIKVIILAGNYMILLYFVNNFSTKKVIIASLIHIIFLTDYIIDFQKFKNKINNKNFIVYFCFLTWLYFSNSFILMNQFINE